MQGRWVRRMSPRVLGVALCSVALVVTTVALSQAEPGSGKAVSVAMLSGGDAAPLPGADLAAPAPEAASVTPEPPPPTEASTTTTGAAAIAADAAERAATVTAKPRPKPCPTNGTSERPCGPPCPHPAQGNGPGTCPPPPCPQPGSANSATACPPPCAEPAAAPAGATPVASDGTVVEPARPACSPPPPPSPPVPPTCQQYDIQTGDSRPCPPPCATSDAAGNASSCPQPCPALATADGKPAPCPPPPPPPPPCPQPMDGDGVAPPASCPPPPCVYPTEPDGGIGNTQQQLLIYCPPPCPSAAPTDQGCTPPCSYEPAAGGPAVGAFAPCASGVTGRVTAGPTCPVERPDEPCADKPIETTLRLLREDGSLAATGKSYSDGSFRMVVAPGSYRLVADWPNRIGGCGPVEVTVEYGRFTYTEVSCDTGIR